LHLDVRLSEDEAAHRGAAYSEIAAAALAHILPATKAAANSRDDIDDVRIAQARGDRWSVQHSAARAAPFRASIRGPSCQRLSTKVSVGGGRRGEVE
jgi:hypothetical protein